MRLSQRKTAFFNIRFPNPAITQMQSGLTVFQLSPQRRRDSGKQCVGIGAIKKKVRVISVDLHLMPVMPSRRVIVQNLPKREIDTMYEIEVEIGAVHEDDNRVVS